MDAIEPPAWLADIPAELRRSTRQPSEFTLTDLSRQLDCSPAFARRLAMVMVKQGRWSVRTDGKENGRRCNFYRSLTGAAGITAKGPMRSDAKARAASRPPRRKGKR